MGVVRGVVQRGPTTGAQVRVYAAGGELADRYGRRSKSAK